MSESKKRKHPCAAAASCTVAPVLPRFHPELASRTGPAERPSPECSARRSAVSLFLPSSSAAFCRTCSTLRTDSASASDRPTQNRPRCSGRSLPLRSNRSMPCVVSPCRAPPHSSPNSASNPPTSSSLGTVSVTALTRSLSSSSPTCSGSSPSDDSSRCALFTATVCVASSSLRASCSSSVSSRRACSDESGAHSRTQITFLMRRRPYHVGLKKFLDSNSGFGNGSECWWRRRKSPRG
mmetsp:Transcript_47137/g.111112  ORF Transcript_47137/g.111112 Transcript_47137/m.111112 type:complete len:238 (+) Transcript_47137:1958-2671(+)